MIKCLNCGEVITELKAHFSQKEYGKAYYRVNKGVIERYSMNSDTDETNNYQLESGYICDDCGYEFNMKQIKEMGMRRESDKDLTLGEVED